MEINGTTYIFIGFELFFEIQRPAAAFRTTGSESPLLVGSRTSMGSFWGTLEFLGICIDYSEYISSPDKPLNLF